MTTLDTLEEKKRLLKTLWEKKKILVTSIFFFSHNVFYPMKDIFNVLSNISFVVRKYFKFRQVFSFFVC